MAASVRLQRLRDTLAQARADGRDFDAVWPRAITNAFSSDRDMREALRATNDAWRRAYEGRPATRADTAACRLHGLWAEPDMLKLAGSELHLAP
jgi:hypothetical protein